MYDLSKKIDNFSSVPRIAFVLADEIKKLLSAEFVCVVEYTYSKISILSSLPSKSLDKDLSSPHEIFYILKTLLQEKSGYIDENDIQSEYLKQYFPLFNFDFYRILPMYNDEGRIITLEIYGKIHGILSLKRNLLQKISEIFQKAFQARITLQRDILKVKKNETIIKFLDRIRNSLDEDELEKLILEEISQAFEADRTFFIFSYSDNPQTPKMGKEYLSNPYVKSLKGNNLDCYGVWKQLKETQANPPVFVIENSEKFIKQNKLENSPIDIFIKKSQIKSSYPFLIYSNEKYSMYVVLQYIKNIVIFDKNDFEIMELLTKQTHIAITQAKLHTTLITNSREEKLLIDLIGILRSSFSLNKVANEFTSKTGIFFDAQRCVIRFFDNKTKEFKGYNEAFEYKRDYTVLSTKNSNLQKELGNFLINAEKFHDTISIIYSKDLLGEDFEYKDDIINYFERYELKSFYLAFIRYNGKLLGFLSLHFNEETKIPKGQIELMKALANQLGIAIHQSELYFDIQNVAKKEKFLKEVYVDTIGLQDKEQIYKYFAGKIKNLLEAAGVVFGESYSKYSSEFMYYEYYKQDGQNISKFKEYDFFKEIINKRDFYYFCRLSDINDTKNFIEETGIICMGTVPINEKIIMILFFDKKREFSNYEKNLIFSLIEAISNTIKESLHKTEINTLRETFLSTLTHDLQVPVLAQRNAISYLLTKLNDKDEKLGDLLKYLQESNEQTEDMLKVLSAIYRYETGKMELNKEYFDFILMINSVIEKFKDRIEEENITIKKEFPQESIIILADESEIEKIVAIFFLNAFENNNNGEVIIEIKIEENLLKCCISTGNKSINENLSKIILDRDIIASKLERRIGEGIHLYFAKLIALAHNGHVYINDKQGYGIIVCLELPIQ